MSVELIKPILMIPGPMDVPDEVLKRLGHQVFPHYDKATRFPQFYNELTDKMKIVFGLENGRVFIPSGSGTLAVNMALASLCTPADEVLVIANGTLGEYAEKNLNCLGVPFTFVNDTWGKAIDPGKVRDAMKKKRYPFIYMTHNESSTSVVNPIPPIGEIAREFDSLLIIDSISGVGGVVVEMGANGADVVAGASQKCLELPPGLAPVAVGERAWRYMENMKNRRVPFYLDFQSWKNAAITMHDHHPQPVTGNTSFLYALDWSVDQILKEGLYNRQERFRAAGKRLRAGFAELGFRMSADPNDASPVVTDFYTPKGIFGEEFRTFCMEKHNIMIGQGFAYKDKEGRSLTFRIAHFGLSANPDRIELMIKVAGEFMKSS
jgi:aspartate aminotransferase-like enzyme